MYGYVCLVGLLHTVNPIAIRIGISSTFLPSDLAGDTTVVGMGACGHYFEKQYAFIPPFLVRHPWYALYVRMVDNMSSGTYFATLVTGTYRGDPENREVCRDRFVL